MESRLLKARSQAAMDEVDISTYSFSNSMPNSSREDLSSQDNRGQLESLGSVDTGVGRAMSWRKIAREQLSSLPDSVDWDLA